MNPNSRGFKILNAINAPSNFFGDNSKVDKNCEDYELLSSIHNLNAECAKTQELFQKEGKKICTDITEDSYIPPNEENNNYDLFPINDVDNIDIVEDVSRVDNNSNLQDIIRECEILFEDKEDFRATTSKEQSDVAESNQKLNTTIATTSVEIHPSEKILTIPCAQDNKLVENTGVDYQDIVINSREEDGDQSDTNQETSDEEWVGGEGSDTDQDTTDAEHHVTGEDAASMEEENNTENGEGSNRKRSKSRFRDSKTWKYNKNKKRREEGLPYLGRKNNKFDIQKDKRQLKKRCSCNMDKSKNIQCFKLSEEERLSIFKRFWKLTWNERKVYVSSRVITKKTQRARNRKNEIDTRRAYSLQYFLDKHHERIRICKSMFSNTLGMSERTIVKWLKDDRDDAEEKVDNKEVRTESTRNLKSAEKRLAVKDFYNCLPKLESHYCRKSTTKLYLEPRFKTKAELYNFYKENWCKEKQIVEPASLTLFMYILDEMNLSIFSPKKDECDLCVGYRTKNIQETEYDIHILKKEEAREEKQKDKESRNRVFTLDLQSVLLCPKSNVSALYYRTKLIVHNFTIFDLHSRDGYCFMWHEGEGELKANCFASIICSFLKNDILPGIDHDNKQEIIFYSDGCAAQNRNALLSNALLNFAMENKICIVQKYLEKGHTQMECDSMHSTIERKLKGRVINVPADYVQLVKTARKLPRPYVVEYLQHDFFKDFSQINFLNSIRPNILYRILEP